MPFLIDGNNLLFAARQLEDPERLMGRAMLCDRLGRWAELAGEDVRVIFDGPAPSTDLARQIGHPALNVSYSGAGKSADVALIEVLETDSAARRLVLVSSDRQIVRAAKRRRAKTLRSEEFWPEVQARLAEGPPAPRVEPPEKWKGLPPADTDEWLREFDV